MSAKDSENAIVSGVIQSEESCRCFSLSEILIVTNNFDDALVIGIGGFGKVYKGSIDNGTIIVAIKRLKFESNQGAKEFWTEVKMLSKLRNTHLVALIGYCNECEEMILVYEYIARGPLADHLYKICTKESGMSISPLTWAQRPQICVGSARGLDYLHTGTNERFIHRDVKITNILLDEKWVAKISDFGLSKCITSRSATHVSTYVKGSFGYLDPEYFYTGKLTTKSDVYAFGVVLLEVLCGMPPVDRSLEEEQHSLVLWAQHWIKKGKLDRIIDHFLSRQISPPCLKHFVEVANNCLHRSSKARPTMAEVVRRLELALASQRKRKPEGIVTKMFKGIALVPKGMNHWWSWEGKHNNSKNESVIKDKAFRCFSLVEIQAATENFCDDLLIVHGRSSKVYRGFIERGTHVVAIKRTNQMEMKVFNEKRMQSLLCHDHIVSLIGLCDDGNEMIRVYDYMANGSLQDHIYRMGNDPLVWKKRLEICIDAVRGLQYLQEGGILHGGVLIKASNILLDEKLVAKIQIKFSPSLGRCIKDTFGLYHFLEGRKQANSKAIGIDSSQYFDPTVFLYGVFREKTAVYSFGIVLFEVLCAKQQRLSQLFPRFGRWGSYNIHGEQLTK